MTTRYFITLGASRTAGGKVISANHLDTINGVPVALERDTCWCPKCNSEGVIMPDGPRLNATSNGRQKALSDDLCICKCSPPPRLIANQHFSSQIIDGDWHAAQSAVVAARAEKLNTAKSGATDPYCMPILLLDPSTDEPFSNRPYRLELTDKVVAADQFNKLLNGPQRLRVEESIQAIASGGGVA
jgi:uncharacterized Zn-binding protein involved in type VI secretion